MLKVAIRGRSGWLGIIGVGHLVAAVFVFMAVKAQQFPVASVRRIVVMIVVFMVHGEFAQTLAAELSATTAANLWEKFKGAFPVTVLPFLLDTARLRNPLFDIVIIVV